MNFELINKKLKIQNSKFKIAEGDNSKLKIQNSKSPTATIQNSKFKTQNSNSCKLSIFFDSKNSYIPHKCSRTRPCPNS